MSRSLRLLALGAIGGLIAAWAMEESQKAIAQAAQAAGATPPSGEPATVKAADRVAIAFTGHPVADAKREDAGRMVHYATGAGLGVVYTLLADVLPGITAGFGGLFGLAVSLGLDEAAVPALGLSPPASHVPAERHAEGIGAHIIYGAALEAARRTLMIAA
jgi:putative membrane protein